MRRTGKKRADRSFSLAPARTYGLRNGSLHLHAGRDRRRRGLGRHLVDALLERGAPKVYALARDTRRVREDPRVVPVAFDLLDAAEHRGGRDRAADATLLINNASTAAFAGPLDADPDAVDREMAVNYDGTYATIRAFVPVLEANGGGGSSTCSRC